MRLRITFQVSEPVFMPWGYLNYLRGFIYSALSKFNASVAKFIHDKGFVVGARTYKLFTYSLLYPTEKTVVEGGLLMSGPIKWWVSSPLAAIMEALASSFIAEPEVNIGGSMLNIEHVEVEPIPVFKGPCLFRTLSPIIVSTAVKSGCKLEHKFLSPLDPKFWQNVELNLRGKAEALGMVVGGAGVKFEVIEGVRSRLFEVAGIKVRGYECMFWAEGDERLLQVGYECGLGERNGQGFGMIRLCA